MFVCFLYLSSIEKPEWLCFRLKNIDFFLSHLGFIFAENSLYNTIYISVFTLEEHTKFYMANNSALTIEQHVMKD